MKIYIKKWMIALLLLVIGVVGVVLSVQKFYKPAIAESDSLKSSVQTLQLSIANARNNLSKQPYYDSERARLALEIDQMINSLNFPGEIHEEDQILYIKKVEQETKQNQTMIALGTDTTLMANGSMNFNEKTYPFSYQTTYSGLKKLISYFVDNEENPGSLVTLTIQYDAQTDTCTGTMTLRRYYITGLDPYIPPEIPGVVIGTDIILG